MYIIASSDFFLSYPRDNSAVELIDLSPIRGTRLYYVHYIASSDFFCPIRGTSYAVELIDLSDLSEGR